MVGRKERRSKVRDEVAGHLTWLPSLYHATRFEHQQDLIDLLFGDCAHGVFSGHTAVCRRSSLTTQIVNAAKTWTLFPCFTTLVILPEIP